MRLERPLERRSVAQSEQSLHLVQGELEGPGVLTLGTGHTLTWVTGNIRGTRLLNKGTITVPARDGLGGHGDGP